MSSRFFCPQCGKELSELGHVSGGQVRCPGCSKRIELPQSMFSAAETASPPPLEQEAVEPPPTAAPTSAGPAQTTVAEVEPLDSLEQEVYREVEKIRNPTTNWGAAILMLVVSLLLFVSVGRKDNPLLFTGSLIVVLFLHEAGHAVGMRIFGYRNVRMFFIPLFGAAVSGQKTSAESYREAIVSLLGPLPGLLLAAALLLVLPFVRVEPAWRLPVVHFVFLLAVLNGFNLLPIFPMDGGRFLHAILFSRNRFLEAGFQVVAALALMGASAAGMGKILLWLGIWMLLSVRGSFRVNTVAARWSKARLGDPMPPLDAPIPIGIFRALLAEVKGEMPSLKQPKQWAQVVWRIWDKIHVQPPGAAATAALLLVYVGTLAALFTAPWTLQLLLRLRAGAR